MSQTTTAAHYAIPPLIATLFAYVVIVSDGRRSYEAGNLDFQTLSLTDSAEMNQNESE